jgi:hypothetical protein
MSNGEDVGAMEDDLAGAQSNDGGGNGELPVQSNSRKICEVDANSNNDGRVLGPVADTAGPKKGKKAVKKVKVKDPDKEPKPSQLTRFDFTIPYYVKDTLDPVFVDWEGVHRKLSEWCNRFAFQLEMSNKDGKDYWHWQGRGNLIKRLTLVEMIRKVASDIGGGTHISATSSGVHSSGKAFNYVMKADSRQDGPWTDEIKLDAPTTMTRQLMQFLEIVEAGGLYPWQKQLLAELQKKDDRWINHLYDPDGNSGKSIFCEYLCYLKLTHELPMFKDMEKLIAFVFSFSTKPAYVIDMPRGLDKRKLAEFYSGVECLKNGYIFDPRFCGRMKRFDRPQICTFGNAWPDVRLLSQDRWKLWQLCICEDPESEYPLGSKYLKEVCVQTVLDILKREDAPKRSIEMPKPEAKKKAKVSK